MKMMGFHEGSVPAGWTQFSSGNDKFLRAAASAGGVGGTSTHTHSASFSSGSSGNSVPTDSFGAEFVTDECFAIHTHGIPAESGLTSGSGSSLPLYKDVRLVYFDEAFDEG